MFSFSKYIAIELVFSVLESSCTFAGKTLLFVLKERE